VENVTHSLIGVVLGESIARSRLGRPKTGHTAASDSKAPGRFRAGILWASVLGSNLPDFDFLLRPIVGGGSLGSLLHHRGYTHTVLLSVPLALLAAAVGRLATRKSPVKTPWSVLFLAGWVGVLCHVGADSWNDYGVHPFWPVENRWFYGDFIFIVEPLFWLGLLPFVFRISRSFWARALCVVLGVAMLALVWSGKYMNWVVAAWVSAWALAWIGVYRFGRTPRGVGSGHARHVMYAPYVTIGAVLALFAVSGQWVRARVIALLPPGEELLALSTTPAPANPLCWRVIVSSRTPAPVGSPPLDYFAREGVVVFQPWGLGRDGHFGPNDPSRCPPRVFGQNNALNARVDAPSLQAPGVAWAGEFRGNLGELARALATHCRVRALLRFVRMPFWVISPSGDMLAGDLRYHSGNGRGFADIESRAGESCYAHEPVWEPSSGLFLKGF